MALRNPGLHAQPCAGPSVLVRAANAGIKDRTAAASPLTRSMRMGSPSAPGSSTPRFARPKPRSGNSLASANAVAGLSSAPNSPAGAGAWRSEAVALDWRGSGQIPAWRGCGSFSCDTCGSWRPIGLAEPRSPAWRGDRTTSLGTGAPCTTRSGTRNVGKFLLNTGDEGRCRLVDVAACNDDRLSARLKARSGAHLLRTNACPSARCVRTGARPVRRKRVAPSSAHVL